MPERLKRLNRLRESWAQRKKSTEYRIAAIAAEISRISAEEEHLARGRGRRNGSIEPVSRPVDAAAAGDR